MLLIEVDAKKIHRAADRGQVAVADEAEVRDARPEFVRVLWVSTPKQRRKEESILKHVHLCRGGNVRCGSRGRQDVREIQGNARLCPSGGGPEPPQSPSLRAQ